MSTSTPFVADSAADIEELINDCLKECFERTTRGFRIASLATDAELHTLRTRFLESCRKQQAADIVELLARVQGTDEEHLGRETSRISTTLAATLSPSPSLIPFAGKLMAPSSFYESFEHLHQLGRALMAPVLFAEDTDAIGTGSLNPIAAEIMAREILAGVHTRYGIRPFVSAVRIDYESWTLLTRKHFSL